MQGKIYTSFDEISRDLSRLELERNIAKEELKFTKHQLEEDLAPNKWVSLLGTMAKKYFGWYIMRKIFK